MGIVNLHPVTDVNAIDTTPATSLGQIYYSVDITTASGITVSSVTQPIYTINVYRYIKYVDAVTYAAGHLVLWADINFLSATNDTAGGSSLGNNTAIGRMTAGCAQAVHTQNSYGYVKIRGRQTGVPSATAAVGDVLVCSASTDGTATLYRTIATATPTGSLIQVCNNEVLGYALTTGTTPTVFVCPYMNLF